MDSAVSYMVAITKVAGVLCYYAVVCVATGTFIDYLLKLRRPEPKRDENEKRD